MEESKKWKDFLCILKFSKTENHSVNSSIVSEFIHWTVNCLKDIIESFFFVAMSSDSSEELGTWHTTGAC